MLNAEVLARGLSGWEALSAADQALLDAIPAGLAICTPDGAVVRVNSRAGAVFRRAGAQPVRVLSVDSAPLAAKVLPARSMLTLESAGGARATAVADVEPVRDAHGRTQGFIACFHDNMLGESTLSEEAVAKRADDQETLYRFTDQLYRADKPADIYDAALDAILSALRCRSASILLFDDDGVMRFVASRGLSAAYCKAVEGHSPWKRDDRDPQPICVADIDATDEPDSLKAVVRAEGIRALAFIPLTENGLTIGKFMAYHEGQHTFTEDELDLAVTIARQLGFSVGRVRAQEAKRAAEASLRRGDERVRQSANQVALVMNAAPVPIAYVDKNLRYRLVNKAYARRFDLTPDECIGRHTTEVAGGDAMEAFKPYIDAALAGQSVEFEVEAAYAQGLRVMHGHYEPEFDDAGQVAGFVAVVSDITERKRDEEALRASEQRFQLMADSAPVLVWMSGPDKACTWFNKPWLDFVGTAMESQIGDGWAASIHPEDLEACRRTYEEAFDARRTFSSEYRVRRHDGEYRWLLDQGTPLFGAAGEFTGYIGSCIDITERRLTEERLRESEERFRLIAESAPVMLWKGDHAGKCTYLNKALRDFWGVSFEEMTSFDWTSTVHPDDRAALFESFERAMQSHTPFSVEARYRRTDGAYRILGTQARPRFGPRGEFVGMIGMNVDITERKRAEEQRTLLINELNHRVKNTLATVQSLASQTLRSTERSADARPMFEARLLALSRAHDVLTRQSWQGASLREVVDRALEPFQTGNGRIRVDGPDVRLSPKQALALSMALHELATNAAKYGALSNDTGSVEVVWGVALNGGAELQLTWTESGGPPVVPPTRTGFGSRLIQRSLAQDLGGATSIEYRPQGIISVIKTTVETASFNPFLWP